MLDEVPSLHRGRATLPNTWCWGDRASSCRAKLDPHLTPCAKSNSKWIKDLYVENRTLRRNSGEKLHDTGFGKDSPHNTTTSTGSKRKTYVGIENFCAQRTQQSEGATRAQNGRASSQGAGRIRSQHAERTKIPCNRTLKTQTIRTWGKDLTFLQRRCTDGQ